MVYQVNRARYFTNLDVGSGYWAIGLTEETSYLTTYNTPYGKYRFKRLPLGLNCSQDIFQSKMDECYSGLDEVVNIVDDILVYGSIREQHGANLQKVLDRSPEKGVKINKDKLEVGVTEVVYFGHVLTSRGLIADPSKVTAILNMPPLQIKFSYKLF